METVPHDSKTRKKYTNSNINQMFPRHETALIHCEGDTGINLGLDFTSRDLVDSYCLEGCATCPVRSLQRGEWVNDSQTVLELDPSPPPREILFTSRIFYERGGGGV